MFIWAVKFSSGIPEVIKESSHFSKSVIVTIILVWLVHIVIKM